MRISQKALSRKNGMIRIIADHSPAQKETMTPSALKHFSGPISGKSLSRKPDSISYSRTQKNTCKPIR
jgi:hypothetical protein